jgi:APA family basic amino acid/polyamine antiporter
LWSAAALVVGHTIGVGIFLTPAEFIGALASPALTLGLWLVCGALVLAGAFTFGELAARRPEGGGLYVYLREAWGRRVAFLYGWQCLLVMDPGITAALAAGLAQYLVVLWPAASGSERALAVAVIWILAAANMAGLRLSVRTLNLLTLFKVLALVAIVIAAFFSSGGSWSHFVPFAERRVGAAPLVMALGLGFTGAFYSFGGFWEASRVAGEIRDPGRKLPRAMALGVSVVTVIYLVTTAAFLFLVPAERATSAAAFGQRAGEALFGADGPRVLAAVVVVSVLASAMAFLLMAPRVYLAMGRDGLFPSRLSSLHPRTKAPVRATALLAAIATVFALSGSFSQIIAFFICTAMAFVLLAAAGLFVRAGDGGAPSSERRAIPGRRLFSGSGVVVITLIALARPLPPGRFRSSARGPAGIQDLRGATGREAMTWIKTIGYSES